MVVSSSWPDYGSVSDIQKAFDSLSPEGGLFFADPIDSIFKEEAEYWAGLKSSLREFYGWKDHEIGGYLFNYMYRRWHNNDKLLNRLLYEMNFFRRYSNYVR